MKWTAPPGSVPASVVAVLGIGLSLLAGAGLRAVERHGLDRAVDARTAAATAAVTNEIRRYGDAARQVAAALGALGTLDTAGFRSVTTPLAADHLAGVTGVSVILPAGDGYRQLLTRPLDGSLPTPAGTAADGATTWPPAITEALATARTTGSLTVSAPYTPIGGGPVAIAVLAPVPGRPGAVVRLGFVGPLFLAAALRDDVPSGSATTLTATGPRTPIGTVGATETTTVDRTTLLAVGDQTWELRTTTSTAAAGLLGVDVHLDEIVAATGAGAGILLAVLVFVLAGARARARAGAEAAEAELRAVETASRQQAALLHAVLAGLEDGVAVADQDGTLALLNPPAQATLATPDPDGAPDHGIYRADGVTPYPPGTLPLRRALDGTACTDEIVVRSAARPGGVRLKVTAQPIELGTGRPGALAISRDVTALRACEADLAAFAHVTAEHVKTPLADVSAHLAHAEDSLGEVRVLGRQPRAVASAAGHLGRARTGAERTRQLVDDLLTYTATRNTALRVGDVDLTTVVTDVLGLLVRTQDAHRPTPNVVIRPLPAVRADGRLIRRLVGNLLSNALTYTPPDEPARIAVRAHPVEGGPGWIRVEIADHGIGFPPGHHAALFSWPPGATRPTAGMGLAICRRVVERHGGSIGAADNPGGGTVVWFTLPAGSPASETTEPELVGAQRS
ncbi:ATP-binding protein [Cryptosporangium sp. NPDC051539]|uniref:ATP-binding protein n=1 Tax=Cryptosporangium sp. NPDC051539 TaxID=3363962 RepID=UPI00378E217F